jgi:tetratricopeptide (TPR) repeat protein
MTCALLLLLTLPAFAAEPDAEALIRNGHWKRARPAAETQFHAHPGDARAAYVLARVRRAFESFDEAVKLAETAVRLDPNRSEYHRELGLSYMHQVEKSSILKAVGTMRKCRGELDAALTLAPADPDNLYEKMDFLLQAPGVAGGDKKQAAEMANRLLGLDAARGYLALARVAWKLRQFDGLEGLYLKAAQANPPNYEAQVALAGLYLGNPVAPEDANSRARTNFALAERYAGKALDLNRDRIEGYRILVAALAGQKRFDDAAKMVARSEEAIPDDLSTSLVAARAKLREGVELGKAETELRKYLSQPGGPEVGAPHLGVAHWLLGLVYEKEGRKAEAIGELQAALRVKADFEPARRDLKRLQ